MFAARVLSRCSPAVLRNLTTLSTNAGRPVVQRFTAPERIILRSARTYQTETQAGWRSWQAAKKPVGLTGCFPF